MFVYKITNLVNGKMYVGKTNKHDIKVRWGQHVWESNHGKKWPLQRAIRKYGVANFVIEPLCEVKTEAELNDKEIYFISLFQSQDPDKGYNLTPGGDGLAWWAGKKRSPESIAKMVATRHREGTFTLSNTLEDIAKRVASRRAKGGYKERIGTKHTPETLEKMKQSAITRSAKKHAQVKSMYASGLSVPAIAEQMNVSLEFVRKYVAV